MPPKKSFSQNFLQDDTITSEIARHAGDFSWIVEIGAGEGALTEAISTKTGKLIAIELDKDLIPKLRQRFQNSSSVSIVEADILHVNIIDLLRQQGFSPSSKERWALFGNIPYGITGKIIRLATALEPAPTSIVLMVQKEVAERISPKSGKESLLSIAVSLFGTAETVLPVPRTSFFPIPKVDSAIIKISPNQNRLPFEEREHILRMARIGFASKRKTLTNNFAAHRDFSRKTIESLLEKIGKSRNTRAEELSSEEWVLLYRALSQKPREIYCRF